MRARRVQTGIRTNGRDYDSPGEARGASARPGHGARGRRGGHGPRGRPEGAVRRRRLAEPPSVPPALLLRHRAATGHRAARRGATPVPRALCSGRRAELRRVPRPHDVLHARGPLDRRRRVRQLVLGERRPALGMRDRQRRRHVSRRRNPCAVRRARPYTPHLRHGELGPARGRVRGGRRRGVRGPPRRPRRRPARPRRRIQALSPPAGAAPRGGARAASQTASTRPSRVQWNRSYRFTVVSQWLGTISIFPPSGGSSSPVIRPCSSPAGV